MLRLKNKKEKRSPLLLMHVRNQKVNRENSVEIRVAFAGRTAGSEGTTVWQPNASTALFFRCVRIITITYACSF